MHNPTEITSLLARVRLGESRAADELLPAVYDELRRLAESHLQHERQDHTLQATALVHEAYLRLVDQTDVSWQNRTHFFAVAAQAVRRILVDHARAQQAQKRGGKMKKLTLDARQIAPNRDRDSTDLIALNEALEKLSEKHPDKARVVELHFFGGLTNVEIAELLDVTPRTIERYWQFAKAWLFREISDEL